MKKLHLGTLGPWGTLGDPGVALGGPWGLWAPLGPWGPIFPILGCCAVGSTSGALYTCPMDPLVPMGMAP